MGQEQGRMEELLAHLSPGDKTFTSTLSFQKICFEERQCQGKLCMIQAWPSLLPAAEMTAILSTSGEQGFIPAGDTPFLQGSRDWTLLTEAKVIFAIPVKEKHEPLDVNTSVPFRHLECPSWRIWDEWGGAVTVKIPFPARWLPFRQISVLLEGEFEASTPQGCGPTLHRLWWGTGQAFLSSGFSWGLVLSGSVFVSF